MATRTVEARDPFGNAITLQHAASAAAVGDFIEGFLHYEPRILAVLAAAEQDKSLIVQAYAAVLWMFSESPAGRPKANAHLARARSAGLPATEAMSQPPSGNAMAGCYGLFGTAAIGYGNGNIRNSRCWSD